MRLVSDGRAVSAFFFALFFTGCSIQPDDSLQPMLSGLHGGLSDTSLIHFSEKPKFFTLSDHMPNTWFFVAARYGGEDVLFRYLDGSVFGRVVGEDEANADYMGSEGFDILLISDHLVVDHHGSDGTEVHVYRRYYGDIPPLILDRFENDAEDLINGRSRGG